MQGRACGGRGLLLCDGWGSVVVGVELLGLGDRAEQTRQVGVEGTILASTVDSLPTIILTAI